MLFAVKGARVVEKKNGANVDLRGAEVDHDDNTLDRTRERVKIVILRSRRRYEQGKLPAGRLSKLTSTARRGAAAVECDEISLERADPYRARLAEAPK